MSRKRLEVDLDDIVQAMDDFTRDINDYYLDPRCERLPGPCQSTQRTMGLVVAHLGRAVNDARTGVARQQGEAVPVEAETDGRERVEAP